MELLRQVGIHLEIDPALPNQRDHLFLRRTSQKQQRHVVFAQRRLAGEYGRSHQAGGQHQSSYPCNQSDQFPLPTLLGIELKEASKVASPSSKSGREELGPRILNFCVRTTWPKVLTGPPPVLQ